MKKLTLLLLLMMAPAFAGIDIIFSHQAVGAAFPSRSHALPHYELAVNHPTTTLAEENHGDERDDRKMKRLKLLFLLMMSLDQYRSPGR